MKYIISFKSEGREYTVRMADMREIGRRSLGGRDTELRAWQLNPGEDPKPLWLRSTHMSWGDTVWLTDRKGSEIDRASFLPGWCLCMEEGDCDTPEEDFEMPEDIYTPSCTAGDYGPGNPWDAPGMSIHDFI